MGYRRDDPGSNLGRREVGGRSAGAFGGTDGGLQWLWRARWRDRTRQEALADWAGASLRGRWVGWRVSGGRAPSGWEWNGSQSGQGAAELLLPAPAPGKMQGQSACRAGDPSGQGKDPSSEGLGGHDLLTQADAGCPAGQVVRRHLDRQPGAVGGEAARGEVGSAAGGVGPALAQAGHQHVAGAGGDGQQRVIAPRTGVAVVAGALLGQSVAELCSYPGRA